jgi:RHS repeat-associated protein
MVTVTEADGLGRIRRTAKSGEVYREGEYRKGWNVSGAVEYDEKGRPGKSGQPWFVEDEAGRAETLLGTGMRMIRPEERRYDGLDRLRESRLPDGSVTETTYGLERREGKTLGKTATRDPEGNVQVRYTDARENVARVERRDPGGRVLSEGAYRYNGLGEMEAALDAGGNALEIRYDLLGRKLSMESPDMGRTEYGYNGLGQLERESTSELRAKGKEIRYEYDRYGRMVKAKYPESGEEIYEYGGPEKRGENLAGRLVKVRDGSGTREYRYGSLGETVWELRALYPRTDGLGRPREAVMEYRGDYLGRMERIGYPDGETVKYEYDYGGNVRRVAGEKRGVEFVYVAAAGYDEYGQRVYLKLGNGVETTYTYDENRRWLSRLRTDGRSGVLQDVEYRFDLVGNVKGYENRAGAYTTKQEYEYDGLYQLTGVVGESESRKAGLVDYTARYQQAFTFDEMGLGNMVRKTSITDNSGSRRLGAELDYQQDYEYEEGYAHRVKRIGKKHYQYDRNGNVTSEQDGPYQLTGTEAAEIWELEGGARVADQGWGLENSGANRGPDRRDYEWDERNRLVTSRDNRYRVEYRYGSDGERSGKHSASAAGGSQSETLYYSKLWTWRYDGLASDRSGRNSKHIYLGDQRIVTKTSRADGSFTAEERLKQYWYHGDHLGSAQTISGHTGDLYERIEYTPYGELWIEQVPGDSLVDIPYRFTGKEMDKETGLYYYGARYMDPRASRWISGDPALGDYVPGAPINDEARKRNQNLPGMGGVFNLVNLHVYHYAGNNPVKYVDPDGRKIFPGMYKEAWQSLAGTSIASKANSVFNSFVRDIFLGGIDISFSSGTPTGYLGVCRSKYDTTITQSGLSTIAISSLKSIDIKLKSELNTFQQVLVLAHELGHALNAKTTVMGSVVHQAFSEWRKDEMAGFTAQFNTASELYKSATGPYAREAWASALQSTLPSELQNAFSKYDMTKNFESQSNAFKDSFSSGLNAYVDRTYGDH